MWPVANRTTMVAMTTTVTTPSGRSWRIVRAASPIARAFAGRRCFPVWAVLHHRGRKTGRALSVPIALRATPAEFVVVLPWGAGTNWVRNVVAAGGCRIRWKGVDHTVTGPEVVGKADAQPYFGRFSWTVVENVFHADAFLRLQRVGCRPARIPTTGCAPSRS